MIDHLIECPVPEMNAVHPLHPDDAEYNCICDALRACEKRVRQQVEQEEIDRHKDIIRGFNNLAPEEGFNW